MNLEPFLILSINLSLILTYGRYGWPDEWIRLKNKDQNLIKHFFPRECGRLCLSIACPPFSLSPASSSPLIDRDYGWLNNVNQHSNGVSEMWWWWSSRRRFSPGSYSFWLTCCFNTSVLRETLKNFKQTSQVYRVNKDTNYTMSRFSRFGDFAFFFPRSMKNRRVHIFNA